MSSKTFSINTLQLSWSFCCRDKYHNQSNLGRRAYFSVHFHITVRDGSQAKNLKQEMKQKSWTTAAYWLAQSAFVSTQNPLPGVAQPQ